MDCLRSLVLSSLPLLFLGSCMSADRQHNLRGVEHTKKALHFAGRAFYYYRLQEGAFPSKRTPWNDLWSKKFLSPETPYITFIEDPHALIVCDYWDKSLRCTVSDEGVILTSTGANGVFGDEDDLVEVVQPQMPRGRQRSDTEIYPSCVLPLRSSDPPSVYRLGWAR